MQDSERETQLGCVPGFYTYSPCYGVVQVSDLLQITPLPQLAQIDWVKCCHKPSSVLICLLNRSTITGYQLTHGEEKMVPPRFGLEIKR